MPSQGWGCRAINQLTLMAPAKVNLVLEVLKALPDGYHEVKTVLQTVSLWDELSIESAEELRVLCPGAQIDPEENTAYRAAFLLRSRTAGRAGALMHLRKVIPVAAGLGGESSDAAAALMGLNQLWGLGLSREELARLGAGLGSDVPFFVYGGTALAEGKGEQVTTLPPLRPHYLVLLCPPFSPVPRKTGQLYQSLKPASFTSGEHCRRLIAGLKAKDVLDPAWLYNVFETVAYDFFAGLKDWEQRFLTAGAERVHLVGSGPALFSVAQNEQQAQRIKHNLMGCGGLTYVVQTR